MLLHCTESTALHPEGIFAGVCVDVIDLGLRTTTYKGETRELPKLRLVFETDTPGAAPMHLARTFTASLHPKARLADFLGKWRGRAVAPGDQINTDNLLGTSCTLVVSHQQRADGSGVYASIDAISRPTRKVTPSGSYDPKAARARLAEQQAANGNHAASAAARPTAGTAPAAAVRPDPEDTEIGF